jgi:hypothetical protein
MDARDGTPAEDVTSFLNGMEFGLLALKGRLRELDDPRPADLEAAIESVREDARRVRQTDPSPPQRPS